MGLARTGLWAVVAAGVLGPRRDPWVMGPSGLRLGLDLGTTSVKTVLLDAQGNIVKRVRVPLSKPGPERPAADWVEATRSSLGALGSLRERVVAVGLSGLTPTVVCVDSRGEPVRPVMTWHDTRGAEEARSLEALFGPSEPLLGTGLPWSASYPPAKLAWLARHERRTVAATRFVLQVKDYLGLCLTGTAVSDAWSSKGLCNVLTGKAAQEVVTACGWDPVVVPEIRPAWAPRGRLTSEAARRFGLPEGLPVAVGWSDALAGFLALGAFQRPRSVIILGTSNIVGISIAGRPPRPHPGILEVPTSVTPLSLLYGPTQNGGSALAWAGRLLDRNVGEVLTESLAATGDVPVFTPYLAGERTPIWDSDVRAGLVNLSERTGQAELCRAVVRGVVASSRHVLDDAEALIAGPVGPEVVLGGYGADHPAWQLAFAEQLGRPFATVADDVSVVGASMLAAAAATGERIEDLPLVTPTAPVAPTSLDMGASLQHAYLRLSRAVLAEAHAENPSGPGAPPAKLDTSDTHTYATHPPSTVTTK